jgi:signal transduction histidine kinase
VPADPGEVRERLARIRAALDQGIDLKRRVVEDLRPTLLDTMGLVAALRWQVEESCRRAGLHCRVRFPADEPAFGRAAAITLFRIVQEALTNVIKHARANEVRISLAFEGDDVVLRVDDDGIGSTKPDLGRPRAHGIAGMRHHVHALGGRLQITTAPGAGVRISVRVPCSNVMQPGGADAGTSGRFAAIPWAATDPPPLPAPS